MKIILSPIASNKTTTVSLNGLEMTIDGTVIDLSVIPVDGYAEAEDDSQFLGKVSRDEVVIKYHYDSSKAENHQSMNWDDYTFNVTDGEVPCPIVWRNDNV